MASKKSVSKPKVKTETQEPVIEKKERSFGDPVGAIFLISIGTLFLLNNFEIIPWSVWGDIWRFWPIFLVLSGLRLIIGRNLISNLIVGLLGLLFVGSLLVYSAMSTSSIFDSWFENNIPTLHGGLNSILEFSDANIEEKEMIVDGDEYSDVEERSIELDIGAREITVTDDDEDYFIQINTNYVDGYAEPKLSESLEENTLTLSLDTSGQQASWGVFKDPFMNVSIGQLEIPTSLSTTLGAGTADLSLDELVLTEIYTHVGAGTMDIDLTHNDLSMLEDFDISVGAGTMDIKLPSDETIGWKITYEIGLGTLEIDGTDYLGDGTYTSEDYSDSTTQIDMTVDSGVGTVDIDFE